LYLFKLKGRHTDTTVLLGAQTWHCHNHIKVLKQTPITSLAMGQA